MQLPDTSWRAVLIATAAASATAFVALALAVAGGPLAIDVTLNESMRPLSSGVMGIAIDAINFLGQALLWDPLVLIVAVGLWLRGLRFEAVVLVVGVIGAEAGASVAKIIVGRVRPPGTAVVDLITQASFPSGHVTRAVVTSGMLAAMAWRRPRWRAVAVAVALTFIALMGLARVAVGEHWFTDVVGACIYGLFALAVIGLIAGAVHPAFERRLGRPPSGEAPPPDRPRRP
jgi:undecaprenyl-diphosphatase